MRFSCTRPTLFNLSGRAPILAKSNAPYGYHRNRIPCIGIASSMAHSLSHRIPHVHPHVCRHHSCAHFGVPPPDPAPSHCFRRCHHLLRGHSRALSMLMASRCVVGHVVLAPMRHLHCLLPCFFFHFVLVLLFLFSSLQAIPLHQQPYMPAQHRSSYPCCVHTARCVAVTCYLSLHRS